MKKSNDKQKLPQKNYMVKYYMVKKQYNEEIR